MSAYTEQELNEIVEGFLARTLPESRWTHHAHIITAIWHLMKYDREDALCRLRSGIISYNLSLGGENTGQRGYHETITIFWWEIIHQFVQQKPDLSYVDACTEFLGSPMADKTFPFRFYTKENLLSSAARAKYIEPDLEKINI